MVRVLNRSYLGEGRECVGRGRGESGIGIEKRRWGKGGEEMKRERIERGRGRVIWRERGNRKIKKREMRRDKKKKEESGY